LSTIDSPLVIPSRYRFRAVVLVLYDIGDEIKKKDGIAMQKFNTELK